MSTSAITARPDRLPAAALLTDTIVITRRNLTRTRRTPQVAVAAVTSPVLFLILMRLVFAGAIHIPAMTYTDYLVPAMLIQNVIFGGLQSATGLALDVNGGLIDRFRSLPTPALAPLTGRSLFLFLFVSNAFIPVATLPRWLQGFAANQPVSVFDNALRALTQGPGAAPALGHDTTYLVVTAIAWCAGLAVVFAAITLRLYQRI